MKDIDIVYFVKEAEANEELRYSLRSLINIPYRKVYIAGYKPSWVRNVEYIRIEQLGQKYDNVSNMFKIVCSNEFISDDFILMNDDFFIMKPTQFIPNMRRLKPIDHYISLYEQSGIDSYYLNKMRDVAALMCNIGIKNISSYELHVPMILNKEKYLRLCSLYPEADSPHRRTAYGNYYNIGGRRIKDVKVIGQYSTFSQKSTFLSTIDDNFDCSDVGNYIRNKFDQKSKYEK